MKNLKIFILGLLILGICTSVWALDDKALSINGTKAPSGAGEKVILPQHHNPQKSVLNQPQSRGLIYATDFDGGLPAGWTTHTIQGPVGWEWTNIGGDYGGQLNSTTAANGYMIVDSDWYGTGAAEEADLISPAIDCSAYTGEIFMSVEHLARTFGGAEVYISMSTDNFATEQVLYSWYGAAQNATNGSNPVLSVFEIGAYAAGQSNVKFKFKWIGAYEYWWLVDDFMVYDASAYELTMLEPLGEGVVSPDVGVHTITGGLNVNLRATPEFGYTFDSWVQGAVADANSHQTMITMDQDHTVQAQFNPHGLTNLFHQGVIGGNAFTSVKAGAVDYEIAEHFSGSIQSVSKIITHALAMTHDGNGWVSWAPRAAEPFIVKFYGAAANEEPNWAAPIHTENVMGKMFSIGPVWSYTGYKVELELANPLAISGGWVSIQIDVDGGAGGWMLILNSEDNSGDGKHYTRSGIQSEFSDHDIMLEIWGEESMGAPEPVTLTYPLAQTNLPAKGFDFRWAPAAGGGAPEYYKLYLYANATDYPLSYAHSWNVGLATKFNPCADANPGEEMVFGWSDEWYWAVGAFASGEAEAFSSMSWFEIQPDPTIRSFPWGDSFEGYDDFALSFLPWEMYDGDGYVTYSVENYTFPNQNYIGSYIVFNPGEATPAFGSAWDAQDGNKYAACFAAQSLPNNDWLISPPIEVPATLNLSFWARSYTASYGLERFNVLVSTTNTEPGAFTQINAGAYIEAPVAWTNYNYSLDYPGETIYVAIQCVSNNAFAFLVDNVEIDFVYDYPDSVPQDIGAGDTAATITITGGSANEVPDSVPPVNNPAFDQKHAFVLQFFGPGPWNVDIDTQMQWVAYFQNGAWTAHENTSGTGFNFDIQPSKDAKSGVKIPMTLGGGQDPTLPVELSSFTAVLTADFFVKIAWMTESETNHAGYNILRSEVDVLSTALKLNSGLISEGEVSGTQLSYQYLDSEVLEDAKYFYWLESLSLNGETDYYGPLAVSILAGGEEQEIPVIPLQTKLYSAFPNPFNPATNLRYSMKEAGDVSIQVFNIKGQIIQSFEKSHDVPGYYQVSWNGRDQSGKAVTSGVYFYRMTSGKYSATKKMIMSK